MARACMLIASQEKNHREGGQNTILAAQEAEKSREWRGGPRGESGSGNTHAWRNCCPAARPFDP